MFTALLEKKAWLVFKIGMPLVYFYHLIISSVFFNTAADDAKGLEKWANVALVPMQYFFEGKRAIPIKDQNGQTIYHLERRYDYEHHFFVRTAASCVALPYSIAIGGTLKALAHLSPETRERSKMIVAAVHPARVRSNLDYYRSIGMQIEDPTQAPFIDAPRWKRHPTAKNLVQGDLEAVQEISRILTKHQIPFWVDCGSCLGCYQYGGAIPNDWDIDMGVLQPDFDNIKSALQELDPEKFVVQDWSGRSCPKSYMKVYVRETGGLIDLYNFAIDAEKKQVSTVPSTDDNIFIPTTWKLREKRYSTPMPFSNVFPLKRALFEGIEVPVPGDTYKYLSVFYGENLAPAKLYNEITGNYEKDLSHPYWQIPHAH